MKKTVICFLVDSMRRGGKERRLYELINAVSDDYSCCVVMLEDTVEYELPSDVNIIRLERGKNHFLNTFKMYQLLKDINPKIVHSWYYELSILALFYSLCFRVKFITSEITNCNPPFRNIFNIHYWLYKLVYMVAFKVTSNTLSGLREYRVPDRKAVVIRNGFNESRFFAVRDKISENKKRDKSILMIANYTEKKDHLTLILSGIKVLERKPNVSFFFLGEGERRDFLQSSIPQKLLDRFHFTGSVANVDKYILEADVCVLSTFTEGLSNALIEYMAFGKPVIVTGGGGSHEIVAHEENGILLDQGDISSMTDWILRLLDNDDLAHNLGSNARSYVSKNLLLNRMVDSFKTLYD